MSETESYAPATAYWQHQSDLELYVRKGSTHVFSLMCITTAGEVVLTSTKCKYRTRVGLKRFQVGWLQVETPKPGTAMKHRREGKQIVVAGYTSRGPRVVPVNKPERVISYEDFLNYSIESSDTCGTD